MIIPLHTWHVHGQHPRPMSVVPRRDHTGDFYQIVLFDGLEIGVFTSKARALREFREMRLAWDAKYFPQFMGLPPWTRNRAVVAALRLLQAAS